MSSLPTFDDLDPRRDDYATRVVDRILQTAIVARASDIHLDATSSGVLLKWRVDGNLLNIASLANGSSTHILGRVKALARLITYRHDIPQEGRLAVPDDELEARVGTLPTLHGERAVIRIISRETNHWLPEQLGLPNVSLELIAKSLQRHSGVILITGTAGSGKTTTAYACLREILKDASLQRNVVSLEDPVETELAGAAQSQINLSVGYDWSTGLKALLRQDPEVIFVGEIRDAETAAVVFQAAMTGQLVITTMHARSSADALRRLLDMHVPAHHLRCALILLVCQRLLRGVCRHCAGSNKPSDDLSDCTACLGTGCCGRILLAELFPSIEGEVARSLLQDADSGAINRLAQSLGMRSLATLADEAVAAGRIHPSELSRHFID